MIITEEYHSVHSEGAENISPDAARTAVFLLLAQSFHLGKHYVIYEDDAVQDGKDGSEGSRVSTVLKIGGGTMTLLRKGALEQEQRFEKGREHTSIYRTPYGNIDLSVRTEALSVDYGEVAGRIDIRYGLWVNGAFQSQNRLHIEIEEDHGL